MSELRTSCAEGNVLQSTPPPLKLGSPSAVLEVAHNVTPPPSVIIGHPGQPPRRHRAPEGGVM